MKIDTPNSSTVTQDKLAAATGVALSAGATATVVTYTWAELESQPGTIDLTELKATLSYFHSRGLVCYLGIQVINTVKREVPPDLVLTAFDDPAMANRFHALLGAIKGLLTSEDKFLSIGNEVDVYLTKNPAEWPAYQAFYDDAAAYVHQNIPGVAVGVTTTFAGYSGADADRIKGLNANSDAIMLTYYPVDSNQQVAAPTAPAVDLPRMLSLADGRQVILQEAGFPSSSQNGSSESLQADFVSSLLTAWHASGNRMPLLSYFLLYDFDASTCAVLDQYYGNTASAAFTAFLCSLGLNRSDGSPKTSWQSFLKN